MATDNKTNIVIAANDQASAVLGKVGGAMGTLGSQSAALTGLMGGLTSALSAGAFVGWIKGTVDAADSMNDLSQSVGIGIKELAGWQLAANQSGTSIESVARGVKGLSGYMVEHADKLKAAGITATDANGAMLQLADLFTDMPDGVEKTTLAVELFGKAGVEMIPMLNQGSAGLQTAQEKADEYAKALEKLAPKADEFNDMVEELALHSKAAGINIAEYFIPGLIGLATLLNDVAQGGEKAQGALDWLMNESAVSNPLSRLTYKAGLAAKDAASWGEGSLDGVEGTEARRRAGWQKRGWGDTPYIGDLQFDWAGNEKAAAASNALATARGLIGGKGGRGGKAAKPTAADELAAMNRTSDWREELRAQTMATNEVIEANAKLAAKYKDLADPLQKYRAELVEINKLRAAGNLTAEQAFEAEQQVLAGMEDARMGMLAFKDAGEDTFADLTRAVEGWGNAFTDSMTDMVMSGKLSFGGLADSVIRDLVRMQVQARITKPLMGFANDWLDGLFNSGMGSQPYTGGVDAVNGSDLASDWASSGNSGVIYSEIRHAGGIAGGANTMAGRYVHPAVFADAPRFHTGGITGDEIPIIARSGEGVFTEAQMKALAPAGRGSNVVVNVINQTSEKATATAGKPRFDGEQMIIDVVLSNLETNPPFRAAFGM